MSRPLDAISMLVEFLDAFPTDAEAWCELADLYQGQGLCSQAAFCLEEALLVFPNAWNVCVLPIITCEKWLTTFVASRQTGRNIVYFSCRVSRRLRNKPASVGRVDQALLPKHGTLR